MIKFSKYHGTGNDFIMIDNRPLLAKLTTEQIAHLCHRRFGIGADGLILLQNHPDVDFEMIYYNSDGKPSTMCGNGGRCIAAFAANIGIEPLADPMRFMAVDGIHEAVLEDKLSNGYRVNLKMNNVKDVIRRDGYCIMNTGSPHFVLNTKDIDTLDIISKAHAIRYSDQFKENGINVNFIQQVDKDIKVRTYERGVEDETWSCGTGVVASAISSYLFTGEVPAHVHTKGGLLKVDFKVIDTYQFEDVHLIGPAVHVFDGQF